MIILKDKIKNNATINKIMRNNIFSKNNYLRFKNEKKTINN